MNVATVARAVRLLLPVLLLGLIACGDDGPRTPTGPDDPVDPVDPVDPIGPGDPDGTLECEIVGYPCSYADVPLEIIEATLSRTDDILDMLKGGSTNEEVADWLEAQDDIAEVQRDAFALRFRPEGGRAVWISGPDPLPGPGPDAAHPPPASGAHGSSAYSVVGSGPARHVAGEGSEKRALVLSPFYWHFGEWDDGPLIRDILLETRGYEGGVEFYHNPTENDAIPLEHLRSWTQYQVVHITTHGRRICEQDVCRGGIAIGLLDAYLPTGSASEAEKIKSLEAEGLEIQVGEETGTRYLRAAADFFRKAYSEGLDDTVVFLNACQTQGSMGVDVDIVDALRQGGRAVVLGWSDVVYAGDALAAAQAFFEGLSERGYTTRVAFEKLGGLRTGEAGTSGDGTAPVLGLEGPSDGTDLRIREVVTVLNPYTGAELSSDDAVGAIGVANDGDPDAAPFRVLVEGVLQEDAGDLTVHVTVDGVTAAPIPLTDATKNDDDAWEIAGTVQLPYDLAEDREVLWEATTTLHDGGESSHERAATLSGAEPLMGSNWELTARHMVHWVGRGTPYYATATILLTFEPGQDPMDPEADYVITSGTISWDYSHEFGDCTRSAPALTFDLEEANIFSRRMTLDARQTPVTATGWIRTQTPWVTVSSVCESGSSTREHRDTHNWFEIGADDPPQVVQDGELIRGTRCFVQDFTTSKFVTRSDYVIRRLRPGDESPPPTLHEGSCV